MNDDGANLIAEAISAAEEVLDPLDGLVERSAADPGAAFGPEVLKRLAILKNEDRAAFEALRAKLKKACCRVTALEEVAGERATKSKTWPNTPGALAGRLRRAATLLRKIGVEIGFEREGQARTRVINITLAPNRSAPEQAGARPSASSASIPNANPANGFAAPGRRTVAYGADGGNGGTAPTVRANASKSNGRTEADGADANLPPQSVPEKTGWSVRPWPPSAL